VHLPEYRPHLETRRLVGGDSIGVEAENQVPGMTVQETPRAEQLLVRCPILDILQDAAGVGPCGPVPQSLNKLGI